MGLFEGVNQQRLLAVGQELQADAQAFFYDFTGLLQEVVFELQMSDNGCRMSRRSDSTWRSSSARSSCGSGIKSLRRFIEAGTSGPARVFFQLYNVGLLTPSF